MEEKGRFVLKCVLLLLICIVCGGILITAVNFLPVNRERKSASLAEIAEEGLFPEVPSMQGGYGNFLSQSPAALELATDALMLKMALYEGEGAGIRQAFRCYSTQYEEEYSRYWHGYVVILRPLLLLFDYYEIRIINGFLQGLSAAAAGFWLWRKKGVKYALALGSSYALLMPMALAHCLQYSWVFYAAFGFLLCFLRYGGFWEKGNRYAYFFILSGACTAYLDLLTYPLLVWGLSAVWWILLEEKERTAAEHVKRVVFSGFSWIVGYGGMWMGKWVLGSLILGENLFKKAFSEALLWTVNEGEETVTLKDRFETLYLNWNTYGYKIYLIILTAWLCYWIICSILRGNRKSPKVPAVLLIFCSSMVWYMALAGHTTMHHIFTHRIYGVSIAAFLSMVLLGTQDGRGIKGEWRPRVCRGALLAGMGFFSYFLMLQLRDSYSVHNGSSAFSAVEMDAPVEMEFTPSYSRVLSLNLGLSFENVTEGWVEVRLTQDENVLKQLQLPFRDLGEGNFHEIQTQWDLEAGCVYLLELEPVDNDGQVFLWVTNQGRMPLAEYGEAVMGGEKLQGQMLSRIEYWCGLRDPSMRILYTVTFLGICMGALYFCQSVMGEERYEIYGGDGVPEPGR